jgi:hypothetical protein
MAISVPAAKQVPQQGSWQVPQSVAQVLQLSRRLGTMYAELHRPSPQDPRQS